MKAEAIRATVEAIQTPREGVFLVLPLPPTVNKYWRSVPASKSRRAMVLISENGRRFKYACQLAAAAQCKTPMEGPVRLDGVVYFNDIRRDLDNVLKPLLDALQGFAYGNDNQITELRMVKRFDRIHPRLELTLTQMEG